MPSKTTKGIVVCRTIYGNLLVGPTAEEQEARDLAELSPKTLASLRQRGEEILPALAGHEVTAIYAGLRPATEYKDYRSGRHEGSPCHHRRRHPLHRAQFGAGYREIRRRTVQHAIPAEPDRRAGLAARPDAHRVGLRDWQRAGNAGIVCHCERVTRRDIETALADQLRPNTFGGLKRRTRVTMGRCQGFYCSAALAEITRPHLQQPMFDAD